MPRVKQSLPLCRLSPYCGYLLILESDDYYSLLTKLEVYKISAFFRKIWACMNRLACGIRKFPFDSVDFSVPEIMFFVVFLLQHLTKELGSQQFPQFYRNFVGSLEQQQRVKRNIRETSFQA